MTGKPRWHRKNKHPWNVGGNAGIASGKTCRSKGALPQDAMPDHLAAAVS
jgi:hypothetical protein